MGCAPSTDPKVAVADPSRKNNYNNNKSSRNNGFQRVELKNSEDTYNQYNRPNSDKKPLAFVIEFDEKKKTGNIANRPPPGRLQLAPLGKNSEMTQDKLEEKMRAVERNRENILRNKTKSSKKNGSAHSRANGSRANSGSMGGSSYYNTDSRKMSKDEVTWNNYDSNQMNNNGYNNQLTEEEKRKKERLLQRRRIVQRPESDDEIEHAKKHSDNDDYF